MTRIPSVHVLGAGSMGVFVASELAKLNQRPNITLLLRNAAKVELFQTVHKSTVHIQSLVKSPLLKASYQFPATSSSGIKDTIENLIIATKTYQTEEALAKYLPYIKPTSNIILIQNGLGVPDQLYKNVWSDINTRPKIFQGVISHGVNTNGDYVFSHTGLGDLKIAKVPKDLSSTVEETYKKPEIVEILESAKGLETTTVSYSDLLLLQIKKFVANASINTITSIINCINGELRSYDGLKGLLYDTISEIVDVSIATNPLIKSNANLDKVLDKDALVDFVMYYATEVHAKSSTSMRQDTLNNRTTEIENLNGYIVRVAEANGLKADVNKTITHLVKLRSAVNRSRIKQI